MVAGNFKKVYKGSMKDIIGLIKHHSSRVPRIMWVALAGGVILVSSLMCNFPAFRGSSNTVEPTFAAIMTQAVQQDTATPTPRSNEITPPVLFTREPPVTPVAPGTTPLAPGATPTAPQPTFAGNPPTGKIVFTCFIAKFDQICLMDADGKNVTRLTNVAATEFYASISPDGKEIVFSSRRDGPFQIYSMNLDGSNVHRLTNGLGNLYAPAISPDGKHIAFTVETGRTQNIWLMNRDGSNPQQLTFTNGDNVDPSWSPDGKQISFASSRSGSSQLWVMDSDGSNPRQITDVPDLGGRNSWSPDGKSLAYYAGPRGDHNIFTIGIDGKNIRQLTNGGDNLAPCYSPDGGWITFNSFRDFNNEIYIMRPDGSQQTRLTKDARPDWQPRWGP